MMYLIKSIVNLPQTENCIGIVMVSMLSSSAVDRGIKPRSGQTKNYKISIWCFSVKHTAISRKSKDWLEIWKLTCSQH